MEYLGHLISGNGVSTDPSKINAIQEWTAPTDAKELGSFLRPVGYYSKFMKNYAIISRPPFWSGKKKGAFQWSQEATKAFLSLMATLCSAPVLALPDFIKLFVVETDASMVGIRAVLMQDDHPLAFINRTLGNRWHTLLIYEKALLVVVLAVQKWEQSRASTFCH